MKFILFETYLDTIAGDNTSSEVDLVKALEMSDGLRSNSVQDFQARALLIKTIKEFTALGTQAIKIKSPTNYGRLLNSYMLNSGISFVKTFLQHR